jgi:DNA-binding transcriptional ArsR family regulator
VRAHFVARYAILKYMLKYYEPTTPDVDLLFAALADPSRRAMVDRLTGGPASVSELARPLEMSLPAVVQHLHVLETSGLVRTEKLGRVRTCTIEPKALRAAEQWVADRRTAWERNLDRLGEYLAEHPGQPAGRSKSKPTRQPRQRSRQ